MPSGFQQAFYGNNTYHQSLSAAVLPQYKSSASVSNLPLSAAVPSGYGAFGSSTAIPANYAMNPTAASPAGSTKGFDDILSSQYKDNNHLISLPHAIVYVVLATVALVNITAFAVTRRHCFLYMCVAFTISVGAYLGFHRMQIRKKFNIRGTYSVMDDCLYHLVCPCCTLSQADVDKSKGAVGFSWITGLFYASHVLGNLLARFL